jgi:uncharacterized membrane protein YeiH
MTNGRNNTLLLTVDLAGTFVFALEGAMTAIRFQLDFFGVMVLSFATALAGGVIRDLLIGAIPPASLRDWRYAATAFGAGAGVFFFHHFLLQVPYPVIVGLDAAGLGLFAMAGTAKALDYKMHPFIAVLMGTITGVGGGTVRDIFLAHVPSVLQSDVYATAALAGAVVMVAARKAGLSPPWAAAIGGVFCFALRVVSVWQHWSLPRVTAL